MSTPSPTDFNARVIAEFRANGGRVASFADTPLLLLHTRGARSGKQYTNPVAYRTEGERYVIFASKAGAPENPGWYHNLLAHPDVTVEVGEETFAVTASVAEGAERDRLFELQAAERPRFAEYQANTERVIPVVVLTRA